MIRAGGCCGCVLFVLVSICQSSRDSKNENFYLTQWLKVVKSEVKEADNPRIGPQIYIFSLLMVFSKL